MAQEIKVPDLGDFKDVEVIDVLVKPGDKIDVDTPLLTLETEKATMDVPSTSAGVVKSVAVKKGDRVSKGSVIAQVEAGEGAAAKPAEQAPAKLSEPPAAKASPAASRRSDTPRVASGPPSPTRRRTRTSAPPSCCPAAAGAFWSCRSRAPGFATPTSP